MSTTSSLHGPSKDQATSSLSVNYFPDKFSRPHSPGIHNRKRKGGGVPKPGGGREAFRPGEARMPGKDDVDYDGVDWLGAHSKTKPKLRWNKFKWILFFANTLLTTYSLLALIFCLMTWFNVWFNADVIRVANQPELITSTMAAGAGIITAMIGWAGILLNNRAFLAIYNLCLWITFAFILIPGYYTCRRREYNLEGKINAEWSRILGIDGRLRIQNELHCCGYFSPFVEATISQTCYSRSNLPGCKGPFLKFEKTALQRWYIAAFGLVPFQIGVMLAAILCSNHITYRFGKGMMPKAYRLSPSSMNAIIQQYASQLTDQYGGALDSDSMRPPKGPYSDSAHSTPTRSNAPLPNVPGSPARGTPPQRQATYPPPQQDAYAPRRQNTAPAPAYSSSAYGGGQGYNTGAGGGYGQSATGYPQAGYASPAPAPSSAGYSSSANAAGGGYGNGGYTSSGQASYGAGASAGGAQYTSSATTAQYASAAGYAQQGANYAANAQTYATPQGAGSAAYGSPPIAQQYTSSAYAASGGYSGAQGQGQDYYAARRDGYGGRI